MEKVSFSRIVLIAFVCAYMAVLPACNETSNPSGADEVAPELPNIETMQLDQALLSFFSNDGSSGGLSKSSQQFQYQNWLTAAVVVTLFNAAVIVGLSIPVSATAAALSIDPILEADGKWHWYYTYQGAFQTHELELTGQVAPGKTVWEMYLTRQGANPLDNFLWYQGEAEIGGEDGFWLFYNDRKPNENAELVRVDWTFNSETDRELTFTDRNVDSQGFGNTLTYDLFTPNVTMTIVNATANESSEVSWNMDTGEGYIIAPNYNNGSKACWDSVQVNIDCPN